jgi:hypothetical protein
MLRPPPPPPPPSVAVTLAFMGSSYIDNAYETMDTVWSIDCCCFPAAIFLGDILPPIIAVVGTILAVGLWWLVSFGFRENLKAAKFS